MAHGEAGCSHGWLVEGRNARANTCVSRAAPPGRTELEQRGQTCQGIPPAGPEAGKGRPRVRHGTRSSAYANTSLGHHEVRKHPARHRCHLVRLPML